MDIFLLATMVYECYVAICHPLHCIRSPLATPSTAPSQVMPAHELPHGHDPHLLHILFFFLLYNIIPGSFCVLGPC